ncbi:hypothetical protein [Rubrobacter calidifluminis]|uniref:hypothetical protein n=1 Tax=Rubrobacter calidifluminis TaxID=1392640 RepID=UPI0023617D3E|nr:hypothetical protein [Rubrobacter calidifluminis]
MATPELRRASDGYLISDRCVSWERWQSSYRKASVDLLSGDTHIETVGGRSYRGTATFRFDSTTPTSSLANQDILDDCAYSVTLLTFRDLRGDTYEVEIEGALEITPVENSRVREVNLVKLTFVRGRKIG